MQSFDITLSLVVEPLKQYGAPDNYYYYSKDSMSHRLQHYRRNRFLACRPDLHRLLKLPLGCSDKIKLTEIKISSEPKPQAIPIEIKYIGTDRIWGIHCVALLSKGSGIRLSELLGGLVKKNYPYIKDGESVFIYASYTT